VRTESRVRETLPRLLLVTLVAGAAVLRIPDLAAPAVRLEAPDERRWLAWSYREAGVVARLRRLRPQLAAGETVELRVPAGYPHGDWLLVMARYALSRQRIVDWAMRGAPSSRAPAVDAAIELRPSGELVVRRRGKAGHRRAGRHE